jgi:hypothetical protein
MATYSFFSVISHERYFVFMTAAVENPVLHKNVVTNGSKTFIAVSDKTN